MFTIFLSRHFTQPLEKLMDGVNALSAGDLTTRVDVRPGDEFGRLAESFNTMVGNLRTASEEQKRLISEISELNESLERRVIERTLTIQAQSEELNRQIMMARRIQMSLLPVRLPDISTITLSFKYQPMMAVGGGLYRLLLQQAGNDAFHLRRVRPRRTGRVPLRHGQDVPAGVLRVGQEHDPRHGAPARFAERKARGALHIRDLLPHRPDERHHGLVKRGPPARSSSCGTRATSNPSVRREGSSATSSRLTPSTSRRTWTRGDKVILYTDGIIEARNNDLVMFGEDNMMRIIKQHRLRPATELCEEIYRSIIGYIGTTSPEFEDDITLMVSEYNG